jgi:hypothetical protein
MRDLGQRTGHLDAGRAATDHDEGELPGASRRIGFTLRTLERKQHASANLESIFERLESRRYRPPVIVAEIGVRRTSGDNQVVVGDFAVRQNHDLPLRVYPARLGQQHLGVLLAPQDPSDRRRDVTRGQGRHRNLVQQRLEDVVVAAIENGDTHRGPVQRAGRVESAKSAADDDYMWIQGNLDRTLLQGMRIAQLEPMSIRQKLVRYGGVKLSQRLRRSVPIIGTAIAVGTIAATVRRKGVISGTLDTGLNAMPLVGALKNGIEILRGRDFFPDRYPKR